MLSRKNHVVWCCISVVNIVCHRDSFFVISFSFKFCSINCLNLLLFFIFNIVSRMHARYLHPHSLIMMMRTRFSLSSGLLANQLLHHFLELWVGNLTISIEVNLLYELFPNTVINHLTVVKKTLDLLHVDKARFVLKRDELINNVS